MLLFLTEISRTELCPSIKPKLASLSTLTTDDQASFSRRLDRLASAAEAFTAIRTRSATGNGEDIRDLTNTLDQEGAYGFCSNVRLF